MLRKHVFESYEFISLTLSRFIEMNVVKKECLQRVGKECRYGWKDDRFRKSFIK